MAAPMGNRFWEQRSKHGRDKIFKTPGIMWDAACEYFKYCEDNPFLKAEAKVVMIGDYQSQVEISNLPVMKPFTLEGLCIFLDVNTVYFHQFEKGLEGKTDALSKDFSQIVTRIRDVIRNQKFSGAASGFFNASIIARDLGLVDKAETKHSVDESVVETFKIGDKIITFGNAKK